ncbi:MAG: penicillin-binding transpeptidase domain-containing protein [Eubacteriales bacterium]|nr:penicillin-binding transpeptidase domain-containing protein [Eubacteriales bacterium]
MQIDKKTSLRFVAFAMFVIISFSVLIGGLYNLQIENADKYQQDAGNKSAKTLRITGKRGMITDIDSVVLAMSEDVFNVTFQRNMTQNSEKDYKAFTTSILETIKIVEEYGGEIKNKFVIERDPKTQEWVFNFGKGISERAWEIRSQQWHANHFISAESEKFNTAEKCYNHLVDLYDIRSRGIDEETTLKVLAIYSDMQMNLFNSIPIVIAEDIPFAAVSEITGRKMMLPGIDIAVGEKRIYPRNNMASQVVGYVGKISDADNYYEQLKPLGYALNDTIGKEGIEKSMENWLTPNITSRQGSRLMEVDRSGKLTRQISYTPPQNGNNVKLTLNAAYQQIAEQAIASNVAHTRGVQEKKLVNMDWLEKYRDRLETRDFDKYPMRLAEKGAMMVVDVNTGRVLAMAQYPNYDSNALTAGGQAAIPYLMDERKMMRNLCIQERAEPGSIFKMVTAFAALTSGELTVNETISDEGPYKRFTNNEADAPVCWINKNARWKHANQTIIQGIKNSCNYFFYELAGRLYGDTGTNRLYKYAAQMGLTTKTGLQLPNELRSIVGNQTSLYDQNVSLQEQETSVPILVAASLKKHLKNIGASYGISYQEERLDSCIKKLMDMAVNTHSDGWVAAARPILMSELNMTRDMVYQRVIMQDIWVYLNDIKWGGSMEVQMGIGQSITLLTPAAVARYALAIANGGKVYNLSIIDSVVSPEGEILNKYEPTLFGELKDADQFLPYIREGMKGVVDADQGGTAGRYFSSGWKYVDNLWAKTGTSQITIGGVQLDVENNGWFIAITPFETPAEIAVVTLIPNGFSGGESVLAAKDFITWWMDNRTKQASDIQVVPGNELMP